MLRSEQVGSGTGALATVTIAADGTLGSIKITDSGTGYVAGNTITIPTNGSIGGTGSGITLTNIASGNIVGGTAGATISQKLKVQALIEQNQMSWCTLVT
jgi:hypothetical protein